MKIYVRYYEMFLWALFIITWGVPSNILAQQPTATFKKLSGEAMVSLQGQQDMQATRNTILSQDDAIQTHIGETSLELSDGSTLELGAHTMLDFAGLSQDSSGARHSHLYLLWGHVRAFLSQEHQHPGSSFKVETLNALVNVTFSQPDIEVFYHPETDTTTVLARSVSLLLTNLVTEEVALIPTGHTGVVHGDKLEDRAALLPPLEQSTQPPVGKSVTTPGGQRLRQLVRTFEEARQARNQFGRVFFSDNSSSSAASTSQNPQQSVQRPLPSSREISSSPTETTHSTPGTGQAAREQSAFSQLSTGTKIALGAGVVAAVGGVGSIILSSNDDNTSSGWPFSGTFEKEDSTIFPDGVVGDGIITFRLIQDETLLHGEHTRTLTIPECGSMNLTVSVTGTTEANFGSISFPPSDSNFWDYHIECGTGWYATSIEGDTCNIELIEDTQNIRLSNCRLSIYNDEYVRR